MCGTEWPTTIRSWCGRATCGRPSIRCRSSLMATVHGRIPHGSKAHVRLADSVRYLSIGSSVSLCLISLPLVHDGISSKPLYHPANIATTKQTRRLPSRHLILGEVLSETQHMLLHRSILVSERTCSHSKQAERLAQNHPALHHVCQWNSTVLPMLQRATCNAAQLQHFALSNTL
jgi:hypothetical protein